MTSQITLNRAQHLRIVVHRQHHWLWHKTSDEIPGVLVTFDAALRFAPALTLQFRPSHV
jgi:hypothetical protein